MGCHFLPVQQSESWQGHWLCMKWTWNESWGFPGTEPKWFLSKRTHIFVGQLELKVRTLNNNLAPRQWGSSSVFGFMTHGRNISSVEVSHWQVYMSCPAQIYSQQGYPANQTESSFHPDSWMVTSISIEKLMDPRLCLWTLNVVKPRPLDCLDLDMVKACSFAVFRLLLLLCNHVRLEHIPAQVVRSKAAPARRVEKGNQVLCPCLERSQWWQSWTLWSWGGSWAELARWG